MFPGANIHPDVQNPWLFIAVCIVSFFSGLGVGLWWSTFRVLFGGGEGE